jgi:hypothetical protein
MPTPAALSQASCDFGDVPGAVWWGTQRQMTLEQIARYMAPVYWFSPDEPLLRGAEGEDIRLPEVFPFETAPDRPVVYYLFDDMVTVEQGVEGFAEDEVPTLVRDSTNPGNALVDLERTVGFRMHFYAYFSSEEGIGAHVHDVEGAEFRMVVFRSTSNHILENHEGMCDQNRDGVPDPTYIFVITQVTGKAHGIVWFWNTSDTDVDSRFPMTLLVEEGKHALATDKNADGYFTPAYDVSRHVNDAWGIRDNMRTGTLATGGHPAAAGRQSAVATDRPAVRGLGGLRPVRAAALPAHRDGRGRPAPPRELPEGQGSRGLARGQGSGQCEPVHRLARRGPGRAVAVDRVHGRR